MKKLVPTSANAELRKKLFRLNETQQTKGFLSSLGLGSRLHHYTKHQRQHCENIENKKVLLRERKRHTTSRVASAHYAALSNGRGGVTPSSHGGGYPIQ